MHVSQIAISLMTMDIQELIFANGGKLDGMNFSGKNLSGLNLEGVSFQNADFRDANLAKTNLRHANLTGADLYKANLENSDLTQCIARNARFYGACLKGVTLVRTDFCDADLSLADLVNANLLHTDFTRAILLGAKVSDIDLQESCRISSTILPTGDRSNGKTRARWDICNPLDSVAPVLHSHNARVDGEAPHHSNLYLTQWGIAIEKTREIEKHR